MPIENGATVKVLYEGTFDSGEVFDSSAKHGNEPLAFEVGAHQVVPGFEQAVIGKDVGDEFSVRLEPEEAYGPRDPDRVQEVPRAQFPPDQDPAPGMMVQLQQRHGDHVHQIMATITHVAGDAVTLDFNHPMAGKTLNFKIKVVAVE